jgi:hypothetical protein
MSKTYFMMENALGRVSLTRFWGGEANGKSIQLTVDTPYDKKEQHWCKGIAYCSLNRNEVKLLRDQLTRFLDGDTSDCSDEININQETSEQQRKHFGLVPLEK